MVHVVPIIHENHQARVIGIVFHLKFFRLKEIRDIGNHNLAAPKSNPSSYPDHEEDGTTIMLGGNPRFFNILTDYNK